MLSAVCESGPGRTGLGWWSHTENTHPDRTWVPSTCRSCVLPHIYVDVWNSHWCLTKQYGHSVASWRMRTWEVKSSGDVLSKSPLSANGKLTQPGCGRWCPCPQLHSGEAESQTLQDLGAGGGSLCQTGSGWSGAEQTQGLGWWLGRKSTHWMWNATQTLRMRSMSTILVLTAG